MVQTFAKFTAASNALLSAISDFPSTSQFPPLSATTAITSVLTLLSC